MFALVEILQGDTSLKGKLYDAFSSPKIQWERIELPEGETPFFKIKLQKHKGKIPWEDLEKCVGKLGKSLVMTRDIKLEKGSNLLFFIPQTLPKILLINSAIEHIKSLKIEPIGRSITIFDEDGIYTEYAEKFVLYFGDVRIVTGKQSKYENTAAQIMDKYGASLVITEDRSADTDVVISPSPWVVPLTFNGVMYSCDSRYLMSGKCFWGEGITLPPAYDKLCPEGIDKIVFASALYEKCGVKEFADAKFDVLRQV